MILGNKICGILGLKLLNNGAKWCKKGCKNGVKKVAIIMQNSSENSTKMA